MTSPKILFWLAVAAAASCAACAGSPTASLSGTVTYDGAPRQGLQVALLESSGGQLHSTGLLATTDAAGRYSFPRVHAGIYRATFETPLPYPPGLTPVTGGTYDDRDMAVIEFTVSPGGSQVHDFPLRSPIAEAAAAGRPLVRPAATAGPQPAPAPSRPGEPPGWGALHIGMTEAEVTAALGRPSEVRTDPDKKEWKWMVGGQPFVVDLRDGKVCSFGTFK